MQKTCIYCKNIFTADRKDKRYCSSSCRQQSYMTRKVTAIGFIDLKENFLETVEKKSIKHQNVNVSDRQNIKASTFKNVLRNDLNENDGTRRNKSGQAGKIKEAPEGKEYKYIVSTFVDTLRMNNFDRKTVKKLNVLVENPANILEVIWVSIRFRCILESILTLSEMNEVSWEDLAELSNALTLLTKSNAFKKLPPAYPYFNEINKLQEKLWTYCQNNQDKPEILFRLQPEIKNELMLYRYELSKVFTKVPFSKLSFTDKQPEIKNQNERQNYYEKKYAEK
jgi:hypothetical protein